MNQNNFYQLWSEFCTAWPLKRIKQMTFEDYKNPAKDDAFVYWAESGINRSKRIVKDKKIIDFYHPNDRENVQKEARSYGGAYTWVSSSKKIELEKDFATVKDRIIQVIEATQSNDFKKIEEIDLSATFKWKIAFLYQNKNKPKIFPMFKKEALFYNYLTINPKAKLNKTPYYLMYQTLFEYYKTIGDVFGVAQYLWKKFEAKQKEIPKAWIVNLSNILTDINTIENLCNSIEIQCEDIDLTFIDLLNNMKVSEKDRIVLFVKDNIRAIGEITSAKVGKYRWSQKPTNFPVKLVINQQFKIRQLNDFEQKEIWSYFPMSTTSNENTNKTTRYWKISPGTKAAAWREWRDRGFIAIGWSKLGDLTGISRMDFHKLADKCAEEDGYKKQGMYQVWKFHKIQPGDRVIANQGKQKVLGIGTVLSKYEYKPGYHYVDQDDYPHQIKVRWDDITPKDVEQSNWQRTLIELTQEEFEEIAAKDKKKEIIEKEKTALPCYPQNIILYGPPGTGKTYNTIKRALELILGTENIAAFTQEKLVSLFHEYQAMGQIEFVTFHQAYGYEEFIEGIRPVLNQATNDQVHYEIHEGIFKRIALRAASKGLIIDEIVAEFDDLWDLLIRDLKQENTRIERGPKEKTYVLSLTNMGNIQLRLCTVDDDGNLIEIIGEPRVASKEIARLYWQYRAELGPEPEKFTYEKTKALLARERGGSGGNQYTSLWIVYCQLLNMYNASNINRMRLVDPVERVQHAFDKVSSATMFSFSTDSPQYVLIIDEINRGNMGKIFGELITLLEPDKRLTARNELKLPLSYSPQHHFAVPPNLHILGTMNTADRSIALMDVALRRRFTFEELMPSIDVINVTLQNKVRNKAFVKLIISIFETLNNRIRFLYDRDHQLGHSYFLDAINVKSLQQIFKDRIIPMLQEYFYGDWNKICIVLGCPYNEYGDPKRDDVHLLIDQNSKKKAYAQPIVMAEKFSDIKVFGFEHNDYEDKIDYYIRTDFQQGEASEENLYKTFLSIITIDNETFIEWFKELIEEP